MRFLLIRSRGFGGCCAAIATDSILLGEEFKVFKRDTEYAVDDLKIVRFSTDKVRQRNLHRKATGERTSRRDQRAYGLLL
jgi:hypothetical protein